MTSRIPEVGEDGKLRLNCPCERNKLLFRYEPHLKGGPVEIKCSASRCGRLVQVSFNMDDIPELR